MAAALEMGPREKALYLKHRAKAAAAAQSDEEVASTLAGSTPAGLRTWIRQACIFAIPAMCYSRSLFFAALCSWYVHSLLSLRCIMDRCSLSLHNAQKSSRKASTALALNILVQWPTDEEGLENLISAEM